MPKKLPRSVQLDPNLNQQVNDYLLIRGKSFAELVIESLKEYLKRHPITEEQIKQRKKEDEEAFLNALHRLGKMKDAIDKK